MAEYIEREGAEEIFACGKENWKDYEAAACIAALPAADVQPVRHGRWIEHGESDEWGGFQTWYWKCSECRAVSIEDWTFCPNCGADMREVDNGTVP